MYHAQKKFEEAKKAFEEALELRRKILGAENGETTTTLNNIAELFRELGANHTAEILHTDALNIRQRILRPNHPDIGKSLNNLAAIYLDQGLAEKAEELYKRALCICKTLGTTHPCVAIELNNLADAYLRQGRNHDAEEAFISSLSLFTRVFGPEHPQTKIVAENLNHLRSSKRGPMRTSWTLAKWLRWPHHRS